MVTGSGVPGRIIAGWERPVFFQVMSRWCGQNLNGSVKPEVIQALLTGQERMFPRSWILSTGNLERNNFHGKFRANRVKCLGSFGTELPRKEMIHVFPAGSSTGRFSPERAAHGRKG